MTRRSATAEVLPWQAATDEPDDAPRRNDVLHLRVYRDLRNGLTAGLYAPGQVLSLRRIAAAAGTSPMPVRQAIERLIAERALVMLPNRTVVVPRLAQRDFEELTAVRLALEGQAAALAAQRGPPDLPAALSGLNAAMLAAAAAGDAAVALSRNHQFHFHLYRAAESDVLLPLIRALWLQVGPLIHLAKARPLRRWDGKYHEAAIAALVARDADGARVALEDDIRASADALLNARVFDM